MKRQSGIEVGGRRFVDTKTAAGFWNLTARTVAEYCKQGMIPDAFKDMGGHWCIPTDARRPLAKHVIRKVLMLVLQLKNNPDYTIDYDTLEISEEMLPNAFDYLSRLDYILPIEEDIPHGQIPYRAQLTEKGSSLLFDGTSLDASAKKEPLKGLSIASATDIVKLSISLAELVRQLAS